MLRPFLIWLLIGFTLAALIVVAPVRAASQEVYLRSQTPLVTSSQLTRALPGFQAGANEFNAWWGSGPYLLRYGNAPSGSWQITIRSGGFFDPGGFHFVGPNGPYAIVFAALTDWQITLSHELFEMAADPFLTRTAQGAENTYLLEVADPVESFFYLRKGVRISDFIGPQWYTGGPHLDRMHLCTKREQILPGGYASIWDGSDWIFLEG